MFKQFQRLKKNLEPQSAPQKRTLKFILSSEHISIVSKTGQRLQQKIIDHSHLGICKNFNNILTSNPTALSKSNKS